jgi:CheY-like chemotaxis protein
MRILIAEDETIVRLDLRGVLERLGHEVMEARDGSEAVVLAG